jgi:hypothetical protein
MIPLTLSVQVDKTTLPLCGGLTKSNANATLAAALVGTLWLAIICIIPVIVSALE